jgi:sarcosine oxidase subunit alpha
MVLDDGVVMRIADDRFVATTTTGNAAVVLDWFEEWLQTEWPDLRARCTSVTEQWATVAIAGPAARAVVAALAPDLPVDADSFGHMAIREAQVAGLAARVCRVSFSGELAFEISVPGYDGLALWEAAMRAGAPHGITPYGTEAMHVLRAEKGYFIVGQDTDGTVTPHDLGYGWAVARDKGDFIGRRSHGRAAMRRPDRLQLVALLPGDGATRLVEGAQVTLEPPIAGTTPSAGHVTSSYESAALGRPFALALVARGRGRVGETVHVTHGAGAVAATVASPVLYDPEGSRRDG